MEPKQFFYILKGEPIPISKIKNSSTQRIWNTQKSDKFSWSMQLANQHEGNDIFTGPVHLDVFFYMMPPDYAVAKKKGIISGKYNYYLPLLSSFIRFLEEAAVGVLWNDPCLLSSLKSFKMYDENPRTEFTITKLKR